jgi:uncharacterized membrane protein YfcA
MYYNYFIILLIGVIGGMIESSMGISLIILPLLLLSNIIIDYKIALGTTMTAFLLPLSIGAVYIHYHENNIKVDYAIILAISYFIGTTLGTSYVVKVSNESITLFSSIVLFIISIYYMYRYFYPINEGTV